MSGARKFASRLVNRNPGNLNLLGVRVGGSGYQLEASSRREDWVYRVRLELGSGETRAVVEKRGQRGPVLSASSGEWGVRRQLYSTTDVSAAEALGRVLGRRALMAGLFRLSPADLSAHSAAEDADAAAAQGKSAAFHHGLLKEGVVLAPPPPPMEYGDSVRAPTYAHPPDPVPLPDHTPIIS